MFGLDEESFAKLTKVKEKNNFRKYLLGDGLTTAFRGWLDCERTKKVTKEKLNDKALRKQGMKEEGSQNLKIFDDRVKAIMIFRKQIQKVKEYSIIEREEIEACKLRVKKEEEERMDHSLLAKKINEENVKTSLIRSGMKNAKWLP